MQNIQPKRKHLLLLVIEFPFRLIMWLWNLLTIVFGFPTYAFFLICQPFIFSSEFKKSVLFIMLMMPIRLILLVISGALALVQAGLCGYETRALILNAGIPESSAITWSSWAVGLLVLFLSWAGAKKLAKKYGGIKTRMEISEAVNDSVCYLVSVVFTLILCALVIRIRKLVKYRQPANQTINIGQYTLFVMLGCVKSLVDIVSLVLMMILIILPWRAYEAFGLLRTAGSLRKRAVVLISQVINTLIDFLLCPLSLFIFLTIYKVPRFVSGLDPRHGTKWRNHMFYVLLELIQDLPYFLMAFVMILSVYMIPVFVYRVHKRYMQNPRRFTSEVFKNMIFDNFWEIIEVHIPAALMTILIIVVSFANPWRIFRPFFLFHQYYKHRPTLKEMSNDLGISVSLFVADIIATPLFVISLLPFWRWNITFYLYKKNLYTRSHHFAIRNCFWNFMCQIFIVLICALISLMTPWRIPMLISSLHVSDVFITADDKKKAEEKTEDKKKHNNKERKKEDENQNVEEETKRREEEITKLAPFYDEIFNKIGFVLEQSFKDLFIAPVILLLFVSIVHIPLALRIITLTFKDLDTEKRRKLESEKRDLFLMCLVKILIELYTVVLLILFIIIFWRIPFLVRAAKIRIESTKPGNFSKELEDLAKYVLSDNLVITMSHCATETLLQSIKDLPFIPFFLICLVISPWRLFAWMKSALSAPKDITYDNYIKLQWSKREELFDAFVIGLLDDLMAIWLVLSVFYLWRIPLCIKLSEDPFLDTLVSERESYLYKCYLAKKYLPGLKSTLIVWLADLPIVPFYLLCLFGAPWRFYMWSTIKPENPAKDFDEYLKIQEKYRKSLFKYFWLGVLDIMCTAMLIPVVFTFWKIPTLLKILRLNGHIKDVQTKEEEQMSDLDRIKLLKSKKRVHLSLHPCIIYCFFSWTFDIPVIPLAFFVSAVFPWRAKTIFFLVTSPDKRLPTKFSLKRLFLSRRFYVFAMILLIFLADLILVLFTIILFATLWKAPETYQNYYQYISNTRDKKRRPDMVGIDEGYFALNKRIYKRFLFWLVDIGQLLQLILITLLGLQLCSLYKRLRRLMITKNKERKILQIRQQNEMQNKVTKELMSMSHNILATVLTFCDVPEIMHFEMTCRKAYEATTVPRVWSQLHQRKYSKLSPIPSGNDEPDFKHFCMEGYKKFMIQLKANEVPTISEETRDIIIGARLVICEETLFTVIRSPHVLCLPVKGLACALYPTRRPFLALAELIESKSEFRYAQMSDMYRHPITVHVTAKDKFELTDFWRAQDTLLGTFLIFLNAITSSITFAIAWINYTIMKMTSGYAVYPITMNRDYYQNTFNYNVNIMPPRNSTFLYISQTLTSPIILFNLLGFFAFPVWFWYRHCDYPLYKAIAGPYLSNIVFFISQMQIIITTFDLSRSCPYYNPFHSIFEGIAFICRTGRDIISVIVEFFSKVIKGFYLHALLPIIRLIFRGSKGFLTAFLKASKYVITMIFKTYFYPIVFCAYISKSLGLIGEFITLIIGLPWLLWPMALPWYFENNLLYIPCIIGSGVLIVFGRSILKSIDK